MADILDIIGNVIFEGLDKAIHSKSIAFRLSFLVLFNVFALGIIFICTYFGVLLLEEQLLISIILFGIDLLFLALYIYFISLLRSKK